MRVAVFLLSLFFTLLVGNADAFAKIESGTTYFAASTLDIKKPEPILFFNNFKDRPSVINNNLPQQDECIVCEKLDDDEDVSDISAKKYKPVVSIHAAPSYQILSNFTHHRAKAFPFFWRPVSYRYILQRTLRIWFLPLSPVNQKCCICP